MLKLFLSPGLGSSILIEPDIPLMESWISSFKQKYCIYLITHQDFQLINSTFLWSRYGHGASLSPEGELPRFKYAINKGNLDSKASNRSLPCNEGGVWVGSMITDYERDASASLLLLMSLSSPSLSTNIISDTCSLASKCAFPCRR